MTIRAELAGWIKPVPLFVGSWLSLTMMATGCRNESDRSEIFGKVTLGDVNAVSGSISFFPDRGHTGPAASTAIVNGQYQFEASSGPLPGPHRVVIGIEPSPSNLTDQTPEGTADAAGSEAALSTAMKLGPSAVPDSRESGSEAPEGLTQQSEWSLQAIVPAADDPAAKMPLDFKLQPSTANTDVP